MKFQSPHFTEYLKTFERATIWNCRKSAESLGMNWKEVYTDNNRKSRDIFNKSIREGSDMTQVLDEKASKNTCLSRKYTLQDYIKPAISENGMIMRIDNEELLTAKKEALEGRGTRTAFEIGDRVKCILPSHTLTGKIGIVVQFRDEMYKVQSNGLLCWVTANDLELIEGV